MKPKLFHTLHLEKWYYMQFVRIKVIIEKFDLSIEKNVQKNL